MEFKYICYCLADIALIATSFIFGMKLLRKRNYLLGFEWLVVTFSASNLLINAFTEKVVFLNISLFCDAFSRSFGVPVIGILGAMVVTHNYRPTIFIDVALFSVGLIVAAVVWAADFMEPIRPYLYLVLWSAFSVYLTYFARRLFHAGERLHGVSVCLAMLYSQIIASIYDFYHIPGDDDHVIFYTFALLAWSILSISMYYAYCAMERVQEQEARLKRFYGCQGRESYL